MPAALPSSLAGCSNVTDRDDALAQIARLARDHDLSLADIRGVLPSSGDAAPSPVARVFAYIGGVFIFAGIAAFISLNWDVFPSVLRVLATLGVGAAFFVAAVVIERDGRLPQLTTPFYLMAEALQPTGLLVMFEEYGGGGDPRYAVLITGAVMLVQALAVFRSSGHAVLLFAAIGAGLAVAGAGFDLAGIDGTLTGIVLGLAVTLTALGLDPRYRWTRNLWLIAASIVFYWASFDALESTVIEIVFVAIAFAGMALAVRVGQRALLAVSTIALIAWLGWFTTEHFVDSLGWPFVLMLIGVIFVAVGFAALRLHRRYF